MSTDEKYLLSLEPICDVKRKIISYQRFVDLQNLRIVSAQSVFLLLYKKGWVQIFAYQPAIDKILDDMKLGYLSYHFNFYWNLTDKGRIELIKLTNTKELLKDKQFKLDL